MDKLEGTALCCRRLLRYIGAYVPLPALGRVSCFASCWSLLAVINFTVHALPDSSRSQNLNYDDSFVLVNHASSTQKYRYDPITS